MSARTFAYYRDLLLVLIAKDFKVRYNSTFLGYVWSALHPLAFAGVFFVLFKVVIRLPMENYILFLVAGLFPWQWFANSVTSASSCFLSNSTLIRKVMFPRCFLVAAAVLGDLVHFVITIPIIVLFMLGHHKYPSVVWLAGVPLLVAGQFLLTYGIATAVATCNLFFRDLERLTSIAMMLWFYLTPVVFSEAMVPAAYRWLLYLNPMAMFIVCWRSLLLEGVLPWAPLAAAMGYGLVVCWLGQRVYRALEWRFAEVV